MTWVFAPIKFQADMGLLLSFMFVWNMLGALILLPALAYFLLPQRVFAQAAVSGGCQGVSASRGDQTTEKFFDQNLNAGRTRYEQHEQADTGALFCCGA